MESAVYRLFGKVKLYFAGLTYNQAMDAKTLKAQLAEIRWSQKQLAGKLACDEDTVSRWCRGKTPVPGHVAEYFRVLMLAKQALS